MASTNKQTERSFSVAPSATIEKAPILAAYNAEPIDIEATASSCSSGIKVGGWTIRTVHGTIFGDSKIESFTEHLCDLAGCNVQLPEMPFTSHLELKQDDSDFVLHLGCEPALEAWATTQKINRENGKAVPIMKVAPTKEWKAGVQNASSNIGESIQSSEEHDWTYYTDWCGEVSKSDTGGVDWNSNETSGIEMNLLTDTSVPILFFDELTLYEDELHDFGDMGVTAKIRVMPTCWYLLVRCFVRVDGVAIKCVESRIFHKFGTNEIWRDSSERFADWSALPSLGLGTNPRDHLDPNPTIPKLPRVTSPTSAPPHTFIKLPSVSHASESIEASVAPASSATSEYSPSALPTSSTPTSGWVCPERAMFNSNQMSSWLASNTHKELLRFVRILSECAIGKTIELDTPNTSSSKGIMNLIALLDKIQVFVAECPPATQQMRFGNISFRDWHTKLAENAESLVQELTGASEASVELVPYLVGSFGDATRIDFGTGHEVAFLAFMYCLCRVGVLAPSDAPDMATMVVAKYMQTMRLLQRTYMLEPAGSHGVWGLDDYHCLPFLIGSAQLTSTNFGVGVDQIPSELSSPSSVLDSEITLNNHINKRFHYVGAIAVIMKVKHGAPFTETSPMLTTIANLPSWRQVHTALLSHFQKEVLGKFPVIQHFLFGSILPAPNTSSSNTPTSNNNQQPLTSTVPTSTQPVPPTSSTSSVVQHHLPPASMLPPPTSSAAKPSADDSKEEETHPTQFQTLTSM